MDSRASKWLALEAKWAGSHILNKEEVKMLLYLRSIFGYHYGLEE